MNAIVELYHWSLNTAITIGWPISYIELVILFFNVLCVYLVGKNKVLNYPVGLVGIVTYMFFCYTLNFYSEYFLQMFFFVFSIIGWYMWSKKDTSGEVLQVHYMNWYGFGGLCVFWVLASYLLGSNINELFALYVTKVLFPVMEVLGITHGAYVHEPASFPYLDAFTVWGQIIATFLMIRRVVQSWICWIAIDVLCVPMFFLKGGFGVSIMFGLFTVLATMGLVKWIKIVRNEKLQYQKSVTEFASI